MLRTSLRHMDWRCCNLRNISLGSRQIFFFNKGTDTKKYINKFKNVHTKFKDGTKFGRKICLPKEVGM